MRKLTPEEAAQLKYTLVKGKKHPVTIMIESLEMGEAAIVEPKSYNNRSRSVRDLCRLIAKRHQRAFDIGRELETGNWVVVRVG